MASTLTVLEAAKEGGIGRSTVYEEIASGRLAARKCGRRTLITVDDFRAWLENLPKVVPSKTKTDS